MKKKLLSVLLCSAMTAALFACGGDEKETTTEPTTTEAPTTTAPVKAEAEELPEAFAHFTFDGEDEGYTAVVQGTKPDSLTGATYGIEPTDVAFGYADGPVGKALYLDGTFGIDLNLQPTNTDAYTVSFWMNAARLSDYGPTLQVGYNMGMAADVGNNVTWFNVTQSAWGTDGVKIFPIVWSRNEASDGQDGTDCWPWMYAFDDGIHGKKEWVHVTIVCSGEEQASPLGSTTAGAQYYINGVKVYDSQENFTNNTYFEYTWDASLAPNIMEPGDYEFESFFGINYWDTVFKGFVDDLYVYNSALTAGQVASLYEMGNPAVESVAPTTSTGGEVEEPTEPVLPEIVPDTAAKQVLGTTDRTLGWWSQHTDGVELKDGETKVVTLKNYSNGASNWCNYVVAFANTATTSDKVPSGDNYAGYAEYAVVRADAYGWGDASYAGTFEKSWADDAWATWLNAMIDMDVTLVINRSGNTITIDATMTDVDGEVYTSKSTVTSTLTADAPCYFFITGEGAYIELLSVVGADAAAIDAVGTVDMSLGWWADHTNGYEIKDGESKTVKLNNYSNGVANWNNYIVAFANTATTNDKTPSGDNYAGYAEYAVVRGDLYGWGDASYAGTFEKSWADDAWATWLAAMRDADVTLTISRNGNTIVIDATILGADGVTYTSKSTIASTLTAEAPCYFFFTAEKAYVELLSVE